MEDVGEKSRMKKEETKTEGEIIKRKEKGNRKEQKRKINERGTRQGR